MKSKTSKSFKGLMKSEWPSFLIALSFAFTMPIFYINTLIVSNIMWPGESFHSAEIGLLWGLQGYVIAFSGILFGYLADRYSRIKLMALTQTIFGAGFFLNGFVTEGLGLITFYYFLIYNIVRGFAMGGFWPLVSSHVDDSVEQNERSTFFGSITALLQLLEMIGMVISAIIFQNRFWKEYFWSIGLIYLVLSVIVLYRGVEPKRGMARKELKGAVSSEGIFYEYRLTKETYKATVLTPTNIIAFFEGIFTTIVISIPDFLIIPYLQSPPFNISSLSVSVVMIIFGVPGAIVGPMAVAKLSDRLASRNIKNRIYLITFSMVASFFIFPIFFYLPLQSFTVEQGNNLAIILSLPIVWIMGAFIFVSRILMSIWAVNQPPILQAINLPEAQGKISSWNQLLEGIGRGTGPIVGGFILLYFGLNYQITVMIAIAIGANSAFLWLLATRWVNKDAERISAILKQRGEELITQDRTKNERNTKN